MAPKIFYYTQMKELIIVLLILETSIGLSQSMKNIDKQKIFQEIKSNGDEDVSRNFHFDFYRSIVFENDSIVYYNPEGTLHLYKIILSEYPSVLKLSKGRFHGHNFDRLLFFYNNIIYSYGGSGLFNVNPYLIYFDSTKHEWIEQKITNYPFDSRNVINSWVIGDTLKVLLNHWSEYDKTSSYSYTKYSFGFIDLRNFEYHPEITFSSDSYSDLFIPPSDYIFDFKEFTLFGYKEDNGRSSFSCLDKRNGDFFQVPKLNKIRFVEGESSLYITESTLFFKRPEGRIDTMNLDQEVPFMKKNFINKFYINRTNIPTRVTLVVFLIGGVGVALFLIKKKINPNKETEYQLFLKDIEKELISEKGSLISKNKIETLFQIDNLGYDSKKRKRSKLIREINERGKVNIEKVKELNDRRYINYRIS